MIPSFQGPSQALWDFLQLRGGGIVGASGGKGHLHPWHLSLLLLHLFHSAPSGLEELCCHDDDVRVAPGCDRHKQRSHCSPNGSPNRNVGHPGWQIERLFFCPSSAYVCAFACVCLEISFCVCACAGHTNSLALISNGICASRGTPQLISLLLVTFLPSAPSPTDLSLPEEHPIEKVQLNVALPNQAFAMLQGTEYLPCICTRAVTTALRPLPWIHSFIVPLLW